ncbi:MAG: hypothetical protein U1E78_00100 [Gammaproteobacteria bacterium]
MRGLLSKVVEECNTIDGTGADSVSQVVAFLGDFSSQLKNDLESWRLSEKEVAECFKGGLQAIANNTSNEFININNIKGNNLYSLLFEVLDQQMNAKSLPDDCQEKAKDYAEQQDVQSLERMMDALIKKQIAKDAKKPTKDNQYYEYQGDYFEVDKFLDKIYESCGAIKALNQGPIGDPVRIAVTLIEENLNSLNVDTKLDKDGAKILLGTLQLLDDHISEYQAKTNLDVGEQYWEMITAAKAGLQFKDDIGFGDYRDAAKDYIEEKDGNLKASYESVTNLAGHGPAPGLTQEQIDELDEKIRLMQEAVQAIEVEIQNVNNLREEYERKEIECEGFIIDSDRQMVDIHSQIVGEGFRTMTSILELNNATHLVEEANRLSGSVRKAAGGMSQADANGIQATIQNYLTCAQQSEADWADAQRGVGELNQNLTDIMTAYNDYKNLLDADKNHYSGAKGEVHHQINSLTDAKTTAEAAILAFTEAKVFANYAAKRAEGLRLLNEQNVSKQTANEASDRAQVIIQNLNQPQTRVNALQVIQDERAKTDALVNRREAALTKANDGKAPLAAAQTAALQAKNQHDTSVLSFKKQQEAKRQKEQARVKTARRAKDIGL